MNRLFIIGNGFDIAHNLKTKYCDFINDFWKNIELKDYEDLIYLKPQPKMDTLNKEVISCYNTFKEQLINSGNKIYQVIDKGEECLYIKGNRETVELFKFNNKFFKTITLKNGIQNWVDIEKEYYYQLKGIIKKGSSIEDKNELVKKLNDEFEQMKNLFEKYLKENVELQISNKIIIPEINEVFKILNWQPFLKNIEEYPNEDRKALEVENRKKKGLIYGEILNNIYEGKIKESTLILNFNYTNLIETYLKIDKLDSLFIHIQIHGKIDDRNNKINFGFGE